MHHGLRWLLPIALTLLAGCAAGGSPARAAPDVGDPRAVPVFHANGHPASWNELVAAAANADAAILGENHGHPLGLAAAAALWSDVLSQTHRAALSLEFFERDEQSRVDDYLTGVTDEATFERRTGRTEGSYPPGHKAMLEAAKAAGRPVIASNAPHPYVHVASAQGYDKLAALTPEQRRLFRVPDELPTGRYREDFDQVMGNMPAHGGAAPDLDGAFRGQSLWDWTMAQSIDAALWAGDAPVVQVVGRFHSDFHGGIEQALRHQHPGVHVLTVSFVDATSAELRDEDRGRADFVIYVGPAEESR